MVLTVTPAAADQPAASNAASEVDDTAPLDKPAAIVALPKATPPENRGPIRLADPRTNEEFLVAVRALSPSPTIPHIVRRCVQPGGLVPLSRACMTTRARAGPLLAMRLNKWPTVLTSAAEINEAAREVARAHDRRPARAVKKASKPPTLERAPLREQQHGPWASRGGAGSSAPGSVTLRIFALAAMAAVPFALPRGFRVAPRSSLVPTGELGVSLPERPG